MLSPSAAALTNAIMAVNQVALRVTDGICADTAEQCIKNIGQIANPGMIQTDKEILDLIKGQFDKVKLAYKKYIRELRLDNIEEINVKKTINEIIELEFLLLIILLE